MIRFATPKDNSCAINRKTEKTNAVTVYRIALLWNEQKKYTE